MRINGIINDNYMFKKKIIGVIVIKVYMSLRLEKPMFLLLDVCNNDSYVIRAVAWA